MIFPSIDYANAYFEFPHLSKISGEPDYKSLKALKKQLKANAIAVVSNLGGGGYGHLGLVLTPAEYQLVSQTAYVRLPHPGPLNIVPGTAHHEAVRLREEHHESIRVFHETLQVEQTLKKQIVASIEPEYLRELRDENTNTITMTISGILNHLFTHYGQVDANVLDTEEQTLKSYVWNINDPPVLFFNAIEDLRSLATAANREKSEQQIIGFGLDIIRRTGDMETALREWNALPVAQQTWIGFKTHFNRGHRKLRRIRGPSMRNTAFHQAHQVATELSSDFNQMRNEIVAAMNSISMMKEPADTPEDTLPSPTAPAMNATTTDPQLLKAIQMLQEQIKVLSSNKDTTGSNGRTPNPTHRPRRNVSKYCWTHGACSHESKECKNKKDGHKDLATFATKMGGNTYYCKE